MGIRGRTLAGAGLMGALFALALIMLGPPLPESAKAPAPPQSEEESAVPAFPTASSSPSHEYLEVIGGCDSEHAGECVVARIRPESDAPETAKLRIGMVLRVDEHVETDEGVWHKAGFDSWIRYPGRIAQEWYIAATSSLRISSEIGEQNLADSHAASSTKRILVDRSEQKLVAYEDDLVFMEVPVSTGLALTPTPRGIFSVYRKTPSRYMQGPLPGISDQYYDLPGVPWNLYFTLQGGVIHGAYWHDNFGKPWSHGCVNLAPKDARVLYHWADIGTPVIIQD